MDKRRRVTISKFLSLVLRHRPEVVGIELDAQGWASVDELLAGCRARGRPLTLDELKEAVETNDKQRFAFSPDGTRIRASQGHSISIDLGYEPAAPPELLYHGTARRFLPGVRRDGLVRRRRHHVHLSPDHETAVKVGQRHGSAVVLTVHAARMAGDGFVFYLSENNVWLTERVPPGYLEFPESP